MNDSKIKLTQQTTISNNQSHIGSNMKTLSLNFYSNEIRTVEKNGNPWFIAKDVFQALEISWHGNRTLEIVPEDWKGVAKLTTPGGTQCLQAINEQAVYKIAFRSNKYEAQEFANKVSQFLVDYRQGKYQVRISLDLINAHKDHSIQKKNSMSINERNGQDGGKYKVCNYNVENCVLHTGMTPKEVKEYGKNIGLSNSICLSAKEVLRQIDPHIACAMSWTDDAVRNHGLSLEQAHRISETHAVPFFREVLAAGVQPKELRA